MIQFDFQRKSSKLLSLGSFVAQFLDTNRCHGSWRSDTALSIFNKILKKTYIPLKAVFIPVKSATFFLSTEISFITGG